jgi:protoporphyrin/coproporphyrin ferrochelatase
MDMDKYIGNTDFTHDAPDSLGILLTNLGTPDAPTRPALKRYLAEFLSDPRVIELPVLLWWPILHGIILQVRPGRSARAYKKIWTPQGSPLLVIAKNQATTIKNVLAVRLSGSVQIGLGMRYGHPSIKSALEKFRESNVQRLLVFPLYPQYSAATTASTFDAVADVLKTWRWIPEIRMVNHYHDDPGYIQALAGSIRTHWGQHSRAEKLLFSFHGLPKYYYESGDPYYRECHKTACLVAETLGLKEEEWYVSFQSRFGPLEWLRPYTNETLKTWAVSGIKSVNLICPGFSADCLETLEEINILNRAIFLAGGGEEFTYIPALNDHESHIEVLSELIIRHCQGWPETVTTGIAEC